MKFIDYLMILIKDLTLVEVQTGSYLGEDDIVRLEDVYGRIKKN